MKQYAFNQKTGKTYVRERTSSWSKWKSLTTKITNVIKYSFVFLAIFCLYSSCYGQQNYKDDYIIEVVESKSFKDLKFVTTEEIVSKDNKYGIIFHIDSFEKFVPIKNYSKYLPIEIISHFELEYRNQCFYIKEVIFKRRFQKL